MYKTKSHSVEVDSYTVVIIDKYTILIFLHPVIINVQWCYDLAFTDMHMNIISFI